MHNSVTTAADEVEATGPDLRARREAARVERSAVAAAMGVGRQRVVNIEMLARVSPDAAQRYLQALEAVRESPSPALQAIAKARRALDELARTKA